MTMTTPEAIIEAIAELPGPDQVALASAFGGRGHHWDAPRNWRHLPEVLMPPPCEGDCAAAEEAQSRIYDLEYEAQDAQSEAEEARDELSDAVVRIKALQARLDEHNIKHDDI